MGNTSKIEYRDELTFKDLLPLTKSTSKTPLDINCGLRVMSRADTVEAVSTVRLANMLSNMSKSMAYEIQPQIEDIADSISSGKLGKSFYVAQGTLCGLVDSMMVKAKKADDDYEGATGLPAMKEPGKVGKERPKRPDEKAKDKDKDEPAKEPKKEAPKKDPLEERAEREDLEAEHKKNQADLMEKRGEADPEAHAAVNVNAELDRDYPLPEEPDDLGYSRDEWRDASLMARINARRMAAQRAMEQQARIGRLSDDDLALLDDIDGYRSAISAIPLFNNSDYGLDTASWNDGTVRLDDAAGMARDFGNSRDYPF